MLTSSATRHAPEPVAPAVPDCKALGRTGQHTLGTQTGEITGSNLVAFEGKLFALVTKRAEARISLLRFPRSGGKPEVVGTLKAVGDASHLVLHGGYAYFSHKHEAFRIPLEGGEAAQFGSELMGQLAFSESAALGVRCGRKERRDSMVRTPLDRGAETIVAEFDRARARCDYQSVVLDGRRALVSDWEGRRLLQIGLDDGVVKVLSTKHAFIRDLFASKSGIDFATSTGLYRFDRSTEKSSRLFEIGATPFTSITHDGTYYYVFQGEPYQPTESLWRLPQHGDRAEKLWTYRNRSEEPNANLGPEAGTGIELVGVDDQCVYFAKYSTKGDYFTLLSRAKPAAATTP